MENIVQFSYKTFSNRKKKAESYTKYSHIKNDKRFEEFEEEIKYICILGL